ncbi:hypothetical protein [Novosphingobium sp. Rr 2-17]|uniref:hypothetical protein n=1 Tax=Novosphingobium sp. Rr 2-17 TaxID=555793 RepID=UPI0002F80933|nr:hypothetical protein [Novosphingobium sp. Rr 2-17]
MADRQRYECFAPDMAIRASHNSAITQLQIITNDTCVYPIAARQFRHPSSSVTLALGI